MSMICRCRSVTHIPSALAHGPHDMLCRLHIRSTVVATDNLVFDLYGALSDPPPLG